MNDERKPEGTDPIEAARKGLGLLFQAARLTLERIPTQKIEDAVRTGAGEVGRVIESVTDKIDEQLKKHDGRSGSPASATGEGAAATVPAADAPAAKEDEKPNP
jgi:hypothetical protein